MILFILKVAVLKERIGEYEHFKRKDKRDKDW